MIKLRNLAKHVRDPDVLKRAGIKCLPEKIDFWSDKGEPNFLGTVSADGVYLFEHKYSGTIVLEGAAGDIRLILAVVYSWLTANDPERADKLDDAEIQWVSDPYDDGTSDVEIQLDFAEEVHFKEGETNVNVLFAGNYVQLAGEIVNIAEAVEPKLGDPPDEA